MASARTSTTATPPAYPASSPAITRRIATVAAGQPGADGRQLDRLGLIERLCDGYGLEDSARASLILREAVAWPSTPTAEGRRRSC